MAKKDFSKVNTDPMYDAIENATAESPAEEPKKARKPRREPQGEEREEIMMSLKTNGHKGAKLPRINMAFRPDIHQFISVMARVQGITITDYVNKILASYMKDHGAIYEKALEFQKLIDEEE